MRDTQGAPAPALASRARHGFPGDASGDARTAPLPPAHRDPAVHALRAGAILGVVLGHWWVTALVADGTSLRVASPLRHLPWLTPASWVLQTLAVFFLVGGHVATRGHAAARARGVSYGQWLSTRLSRLFGPVVPLMALWTVVSVALIPAGADLDTVRTLLELALSPLWFLLVFAALTAATPLLTRLHPLWPLAVVLHVDLLRFGLGGPSWLGWVNLGAGWLVPFTLGAAWTRGEIEGRRPGAVLLLGGTVTTVVLVAGAGYPASMVGVPGAPVSNLSPPTLAAVTFGVAQCGLALLSRGPLRRAMRVRRVRTPVTLANGSAMTIFLWHQTALMATTATGLLAGHLPGLHTLPDNPAWVATRSAWLPVFALALACCQVAFHGVERGTGRRVPHRARCRRTRDDDLWAPSSRPEPRVKG
ncbi:acyltransferase [Streptomyces sp. ZYX-F-203]